MAVSSIVRPALSTSITVCLPCIFGLSLPTLATPESDGVENMAVDSFIEDLVSWTQPPSHDCRREGHMVAQMTFCYHWPESRAYR